MDKKIGVLIVEDQMIATQLFEMYISSSDKYYLVHSIKSADMAYFWCSQGKVDLVIMDVFTEMGANGLDAAERIKQAFPHIKIIAATSMPEVSCLKRAREIGVDSFWYKEVQDAPLLEVMDRTMTGESVYPHSSPSVRLGDTLSTDFTKREIAILRELIKGSTNAQIAEKLFISKETVKSHIQNMLIKTGFTTRTELAVMARSSGLVIYDDKKN